MSRRLFGASVVWALLLVLTSAVTVAAQDGSLPEPDIGMLATAAGLAVTVWVVMQFIRAAVPPAFFDRWGATIAGVVGIVFALAYAFVATPAIDGKALLQAVLVGLFGGWLSQNVNSMVRRAVAPDR